MGRASDVHAGPLLPRPRAGRTQTERQSRKTEKRIGLSHRMADPSRRLGWEEAGRQVVVRRVSRLDTAAHERRWIRSGGNRSRALGSVTARFAGAGVKIACVAWGRAAPAKVGVERSRSSKFPGRGMLSSPSSRRLTRPLLERLHKGARVRAAQSLRNLLDTPVTEQEASPLFEFRLVGEVRKSQIARSQVPDQHVFAQP